MAIRIRPWLIGVGLVVILSAGPEMVAQPAPGWSTETVDAAGSDGAFHSLAFSPVTGFPAIAYSGTANRNAAVKLATWNGASWTIETVDSSRGVNTEAISLAFDAAGNPAMSYGNGSLKFAKRTGSSWSIQSVDTSNGIVSSLAFHSGQPSIAYGYTAGKSNHTINQLRLATLVGSTWTIEVVKDGIAILYPSLTFASDGNPSIAYAASGTLNFAHKTGSSWSFQSIEPGGTYANLLYDPLTGNPTIAHMPGIAGGVRFDRWDGSQWVSEIVDATTSSNTALAYDGGGVAAISYQVAPGPNGRMQLWLARRTGCSGTCWVSQMIQDFSPVQLYRATSLAFSPTGSAAISFGDYTDGDLKFAQQLP